MKREYYGIFIMTLVIVLLGVKGVFALPTGGGQSSIGWGMCGKYTDVADSQIYNPIFLYPNIFNEILERPINFWHWNPIGYYEIGQLYANPISYTGLVPLWTGNSWWLHTDNITLTFNCITAPSIRLHEMLHPGWNQLNSPYSFSGYYWANGSMQHINTPVNNIYINGVQYQQAANNWWVYPYVLCWDCASSSYKSISPPYGTIPAHHGFWILSRGGSDKTIDIVKPAGIRDVWNNPPVVQTIDLKHELVTADWHNLSTEELAELESIGLPNPPGEGGVSESMKTIILPP